MALPILLAALGYGIYDRQKREAELEAELAKPDGTFMGKLDAYIKANPGELYRDDVQNMLRYGVAEQERERARVQEQTVNNFKEFYDAATPEEQAKLAKQKPDLLKAVYPEVYANVQDTNKREADFADFSRELIAKDEDEDTDRIQAQQITQQNAAYSASLQRETEAINRQAELDAKIALGIPITQAEKDQAALQKAEATQRQELAITGEAKAAEDAKLQQSYADDLLEYKTLMEAGAGAFDPRANTLAKNLQTKKAKMLAGGKTTETDEATARRIIPEPSLFKTTSALTATLDSELNDLAVKGFKPRIKAPKFDPTAAYEEE